MYGFGGIYSISVDFCNLKIIGLNTLPLDIVTTLVIIDNKKES
jgi:hypothetical protein